MLQCFGTAISALLRGWINGEKHRFAAFLARQENLPVTVEGILDLNEHIK